MNRLNNITVADVTNVMAVFAPKGKFEKMNN